MGVVQKLPAMNGLRETTSKMAIAVPAFFRNFEWKRLFADPIPFIVVWLLGALLTVVIPRRKWKAQKEAYYESYGYAIEYEQAARQNNNNNNNNQNNQNNNYYYQNYMESCSWWNFSCRKRVAKYAYLYENNGNNNNRNENRNDQVEVPGWYRFMGGSVEVDRREREQAGMNSNEASGTMQFVYAWSLALFIILVLYGAIAIARKHNLNTIRWCLLLFCNVALLVMLLCVQGVIETDGRAIQDSIYGWYGQLGVLMVYSCFAYLIFSFIAAIAVSIRIWWLARPPSAAASEVHKESTSESLFTRPNVTVTGSTKEADAYREYKDLA